MVHNQYVVQRNGGYYVAGPVRISLDSVVYSFNNGDSAETIHQNFPALKLAQIYGAIAFYLDNRALIDKYLADAEREFEANSIPLEVSDPDLARRLNDARASLALKTEVKRPA